MFLPVSAVSSSSHPERVAVESLGEARQCLVSGAGLGDEGYRGDGAGVVPAGELDAIGVALLVLQGARGRCVAPSSLRRGESEGAVSVPLEGRARDHGGEGPSRELAAERECNGMISSSRRREAVVVEALSLLSSDRQELTARAAIGCAEADAGGPSASVITLAGSGGHPHGFAQRYNRKPSSYSHLHSLRLSAAETCANDDGSNTPTVRS